ncbi:MAG: cupin domain-containing protein [bacterium]
MTEKFYPEFIRNLPEADLPIENVIGYLFQGTHGQICFFDFKPGIEVPAHAHGNQWGVVLDGEMKLTIAGETKVMQKGDSYYIPAGVVHSAKFEHPCKVLDFFEDADRYKTK